MLLGQTGDAGQSPATVAVRAQRAAAACFFFACSSNSHTNPVGFCQCHFRHLVLGLHL